MDLLAVLEHFPDLLLQVGQSRNILWTNLRTRQLQPSWKVGSPCFVALRAMGTKCTFCLLEEAFRAGEVTRNIIPKNLLSLQPEEGFFEQIGIPVKTPVGKVESVFLLLRDVSVEIQNVQRQAENELMMAALLDSAQSGVVMLNSSLEPVRVSQGFVELTGYSREELEKASYRSLFSSEDWEKISSWMQSVGKNSTVSTSFSADIQRKSKPPLAVRVKLDLFPNVYQQDSFFLFQHRELQKNPPKVDELRQTFISNLNHELRTPITAILGSLFLLGETSLTEEQRKVLGWAEISSEKMATLIGNLLEMCELSKKDSKYWVERAVFSPEELMESWQKKYEVSAQQKGINMGIQGKFPGGFLFVGDAAKLRELGNILLENAFKFTPGGEVSLSLEVEKSGMMWLRVRDTGCGIPEEKRESIFEPFFQVRAGSAGKDEGIGIGLAIAKELVDLMEGRIVFQSPPEGGSLFVVNLPVQLLPF